MLLSQPLLLSSIAEAVWWLIGAAGAALLVIMGVGWRVFVSRATSTEDKMARVVLLLLGAPLLVYALFCLVLGPR